MEVPKSAKRVFRGEIFDVYQWKQKMFDNSHKTFEMLKRADTVSIIPVVDGKILLNKESQPTFKRNLLTLPGGRVDGKEKPLNAAKRELLEETGYASDEWKLLTIMEPYHKIEWKIFIYIAKNCKKSGKPTPDPGEKIKPILVDFNDFIKIVWDESFWGKDFALYLFRLEKNKKEFQKFENKLLGK